MNDFFVWIGGTVTAAIVGLLYAARIYRFGPFLHESNDKLDPPPAEPSPPAPPPAPASSPAELDFSTPPAAFHSTRVICDEMGLPLTKSVVVNGVAYYPKDIVCACIYQESRFLNTAKRINKNSIDWGIGQVNDTPGWHIGPGLLFSSVDEVLTNPEKVIRWMVWVMKSTGKLKPWVSYTSDAYKQWLSPDSPMWLLKRV